MILKNSNCIYLADDDQDDRSLFVEALLEIDSSIILKQAEDGIQLMNILRNESYTLPKLIFLDINMPKLNGFECLEQIKQDFNLKSLSVIMLSTSNDSEAKNKALTLGASSYAVKPNTFGELKSLIKNILQSDWITFEQNNDNLKLI